MEYIVDQETLWLRTLYLGLPCINVYWEVEFFIVSEMILVEIISWASE